MCVCVCVSLFLSFSLSQYTHNIIRKYNKTKQKDIVGVDVRYVSFASSCWTRVDNNFEIRSNKLSLLHCVSANHCPEGSL